MMRQIFSLRMLMGNVHIPDTWTGSPLGLMQSIEHITTRGNNLFIANERFFIDSHSSSNFQGNLLYYIVLQQMTSLTTQWSNYINHFHSKDHNIYIGHELYVPKSPVIISVMNENNSMEKIVRTANGTCSEILQNSSESNIGAICVEQIC